VGTHGPFRDSVKQTGIGTPGSAQRNERCHGLLQPRVKPPAEACGVNLVGDDASRAADQAYDACRSGSA
jgi:hypothetical protein